MNRTFMMHLVLFNIVLLCPAYADEHACEATDEYIEMKKELEKGFDSSYEQCPYIRQEGSVLVQGRRMRKGRRCSYCRW